MLRAGSGLWAAISSARTGEKHVSPSAEVLAALKAYFGLHRFMPQGIHPLSGNQTVELFRQRQVAAILCGPWLLPYLRETGRFCRSGGQNWDCAASRPVLCGRRQPYCLAASRVMNQNASS